MAAPRMFAGSGTGATKSDLIRPVYEDSMRGTTGFEGVANGQFDEFRKNTLEKLKGRYADLAALNPYATYDYTPTLWDAFGNAMGFNTNEDDVRMQYQKSAREYDAQLLQLQMENSYNSEQEKVNRMAAAGLNPDLQGISGASEASEFAQEQTSPTVSPSNLSFMDFSNVMMNALSGTLSVMNTFNGLRMAAKDLQLKDADIAGKDIQNLSSLYSLAGPFVESVLGNKGVSQDSLRFRGGKVWSGNTVFGTRVPYINRYGSMNDDIFDSVTRSLKTAASVYAQQNDLYKNRNSVLGFLDSDKKFDYKGSDSLTDFDDTLRDVYGEIAKGAAEVMKDEFRFKHGYYRGNSGYHAGLSEFRQNQYSADYWLNMDGAADAKLYGLKRITDKQKAEMSKRINQVYYKIIDKLSSKAENGKLPAAITLVGLGSLLDTGSVGSGMFGKLPSFPFMKR